MTNTAQEQAQIGLVSLGCPKALVDSERIITHLRAQGYGLSGDYQGADLVIVNTCGFLDSAKQESLEAIQEAISENGRVIVTGCLGKDEALIRKHCPDVLAITGPHQYEQVIKAVHSVLPPLHEPFSDLLPESGLRLTPRHYAYLKISEGCQNKCSFCIIPDLRGRLVSRPIHEVLAEAGRLMRAGVREIMVISQDTSAYGLDLRYKEYEWQGKAWQTRFQHLCQALGEMTAQYEDDIWIRLHYVYPYPHVDDIMPLMAENKILPYLDIPFQHASPSVLKAMRRPAREDKILDRIQAWRRQVPDLTLRSTFIVGFPGETEEDFTYLLEWLKEAGIDNAGCFQYENVEEAGSSKLPNQVPDDIKQERWERFMVCQRDISAARLQEKIGKTVPVVIDAIDEEGDYIGRTAGQAPDIDGLTFINASEGVSLQVGQIVPCYIESASDYDLYAVVR